MGAGPHHDPIEATVRALSAMTELTGGEGGVTMRFAAAHSDGKGLCAFRYAVNDDANRLYDQASESGIVIVSEPLDGDRSNWIAVPENHVVIACWGRPFAIEPLDCHVLGELIRLMQARPRLRD